MHERVDAIDAADACLGRENLVGSRPESPVPEVRNKQTLPLAHQCRPICDCAMGLESALDSSRDHLGGGEGKGIGLLLTGLLRLTRSSRPANLVSRSV
jgi:hypothetical protein